MKQMKIIIVLIPFFCLSCARSPYIKNYEPINVFLKTQKLDGKKFILQSDKAENEGALRLFNGGEGAEHVLDPRDSADYTEGLFVEKHWKKIYKKYVNDTLKKHWKKKDFPTYGFSLEKGTGLALKASILLKYMDTRVEEVIIISEPMYYWNRKYIMFYFNRASFAGSVQPKVVIMKKEKGKWVVVKTIGDYIFY